MLGHMENRLRRSGMFFSYDPIYQMLTGIAK